jgi:hypothetical protein
VYGKDLDEKYFININIELDKNIRSETYFDNEFKVSLDCELLLDILDLIDVFDKKKCKYFTMICKSALYNICKSECSQFTKKMKMRKVTKMCNIVNYVYNYYYQLLNNYSRYKKGYYYSVSKKKAISLNAQNKDKIYMQYRKFISIKAEFEIYIKNFYNNWVDQILEKHKNTQWLENCLSKIYSFLYPYTCNINLERKELVEMVNQEFVFIHYEFNFKYIKPDYFIDENYFNYMQDFENETECIEQFHLFSIFHHYMGKKYPDMTDESGIAYENYYVPIPFII